jgi:hypothetical protein
VAGSPAVVARAARVGDPAESAGGSPESAGAPAGLVARIRWRWAWRWAELPVAIAAESSCCPPTVKGPRQCCPTSVLPHVSVAPSHCWRSRLQATDWWWPRRRVSADVDAAGLLLRYPLCSGPNGDRNNSRECFSGIGRRSSARMGSPSLCRSSSEELVRQVRVVQVLPTSGTPEQRPVLTTKRRSYGLGANICRSRDHETGAEWDRVAAQTGRGAMKPAPSAIASPRKRDAGP